MVLNDFKYMCSLSFVIFWIFCAGASSNEFLYDTGPQKSGYFIDIRLLGSSDDHNIQKRDVEMAHPLSLSSTTPVNPTNLNGTANNTSTGTAPKINVEKSEKLLMDGIVLASNDRAQQKLGVNGSGQRRFDIPTTPNKATPLLIHDIGSTMDDVRSNKNDIRKKNHDEDLSVEDESDFGEWQATIADVDTNEEEIEKNLEEKHNITSIKNDTHLFYNSTLFSVPEVGRSYWVDLDLDQKGTVNDLLSNSHRRAATVKLSFEFPFYGHPVKNVTIATGGFLYTGNYVHSWLAATQYIAPLMANFDTSLSNNSKIRHYDNGTAFTVEWQQVQLKDKPKDGEFTFQVTLLKNGDIIFVYKSIPLNIEDIDNIQHPVKIGLSDAYILDRTLYFVRRKTIFEYHRVAFQQEEIKNWTTIYLTALPTCHRQTTCSSCVSGEVYDKHNCKWCPKLNQCSTGWDRNKQEWMDNGCDVDQVGLENMCHIKIVPGDRYETTFSYNPEVLGYNSRSRYELSNHSRPSDHIGVSGWMAILFLVVMGTGLALWVMYAYRNPHSFSGQILIRYRPSQWRWRRGEVRYSAATIHM